MSDNLCIPRKPHKCRLCGQRIEVGESCLRWSGLTPGEGYFTSHAHPECYAETVKYKWDSGDWECSLPGDMERPSRDTASEQGRAKL